jgi:hypothetical protein
MIKYRLVCSESHEFEGWFRSSETYDAQAACGSLSCPVCGSTAVAKAVMAPSIAARADRSHGRTTGRTTPSPDRQREIFAALRKLRDEVDARSTYVGDRFADEARKIHFGEAEERTVHGEATLDEVRELGEDGVPVLPLPRLPKDLN